MNLFQLGKFKLHSGKESNFKIDCDALTDEDIECCAFLISQKVRFEEVYGVPTGGIRLQKALEKYKSNKIGETVDAKILIVDDVLTTGGSMEKHHTFGARGFVIFARAECPDWISALFQMNSMPVWR